VLDIVAERGKMQNPETGSGGMLVGTVEEVGPESPLGLHVVMGPDFPMLGANLGRNLREGRAGIVQAIFQRS